jgi:hypothetical protein
MEDKDLDKGDKKPQGHLALWGVRDIYFDEATLAF